MAGTIFVTQGDVSDFQADAVVCPTSTTLDVHGFTSAAFARRFPGFEDAFQDVRRRHPPRNEYRQRLQIGDAFWVPVGPGPGRLRGIVLVAVTGGPESIAERAARSVQSALRTAREHLRQSAPPGPGDRWLVALPTIGLGMGGYSRDLRTATEAMVRTAAEEVRAADETDVAFVAFTPVNYRLLLDARRAVGAEPPCPLDPAAGRDLLTSLRERRCVLFAGAGLSKGAGLPDWGGLLEDLAADLGLDLAGLPHDAGGRLPLDLCLDLAQWYADRFGRDDLHRHVHDLFGHTAARPGVRPTLAHYLLLSMPFRLFLTTNYDDLLERALTALRRDPEVVCTPDAVVRTGQADRPCVVKLHGDATHRTPVVLTRDDFDTFFRDHPVTAALLQGLLLNHTFLFVGYDLRDPNTRQVYSGVAHLLSEAGARAYSVVVRPEDVTSRFHEGQWARQGLVTLRLPGPDGVHSSLRFFDWLAREACTLQSFLHPNLRREGPPAGMEGLGRLRDLLYEAGDELARLLREPGPDPVSPEGTRVLVEVLDLATRLGWPTPGGRVWSGLAEQTPDRLEKVRLLRRALAAAESVAELDRIRGRIAALDPGPPGPAGKPAP